MGHSRIYFGKGISPDDSADLEEVYSKIGAHCSEEDLIRLILEFEDAYLRMKKNKSFIARHDLENPERVLYFSAVIEILRFLKSKEPLIRKILSVSESYDLSFLD